MLDVLQPNPNASLIDAFVHWLTLHGLLYFYVIVHMRFTQYN